MERIDADDDKGRRSPFQVRTSRTANDRSALIRVRSAAIRDRAVVVAVRVTVMWRIGRIQQWKSRESGYGDETFYPVTDLGKLCAGGIQRRRERGMWFPEYLLPDRGSSQIKPDSRGLSWLFEAMDATRTGVEATEAIRPIRGNL